MLQVIGIKPIRAILNDSNIHGILIRSTKESRLDAVKLVSIADMFLELRVRITRNNSNLGSEL